jgi:hypothetical protein
MPTALAFGTGMRETSSIRIFAVKDAMRERSIEIDG